MGIGRRRSDRRGEPVENPGQPDSRRQRNHREDRLMFATIYLPDFYLQAALRHQPELSGKPVALIDDQEKKAVIIQLNSAAEEKGVRIGMTPSQSLARYLDLVIKVRSHSQEKLLQDILLNFAGTLAP